MSSYYDSDNFDQASSFVLADDGSSQREAAVSSSAESLPPLDTPVLALSSPSPSPPRGQARVSYPDNVDHLHGLSFTSWEDAQNEIADAAERADFAVVRRRKRKPNITVPGGYKYIDLECYMARSNERQTPSSRHNSASRCSCKWYGTLAYKGGIWEFNLKHGTHNHPRQVGAEIPANRRRHRSSHVNERVMQLSRAFEARAVDVAREVSKEFGISVTPRDVQNIRDAEGAKRRNNLTATQCFFRELTKDEDCILEFELDAQDRPMYVLFTFKSCIEVWKENPEVLMIDNTYKTNRFELPLMEITGATGLNTTFSVAWCLMKGEKTEDYHWVLSHLDSIMSRHEIDYPNVIISDYEKALLSSIRMVWPHVPSQLCVWHVNKNVQFNIAKKWEGTLDGTHLGSLTARRGALVRHQAESEAQGDQRTERQGEAETHQPESSSAEDDSAAQSVSATINRRWADNADGCFEAWQTVAQASTRDEFDDTWSQMKTEFRTQRAILEYLETHYIPRRSLFARYAIKEIQNFGVKSTSRTESAHGSLKAHLSNSRANLDVLLMAIKSTLEQQRDTYLRKLNTERGKDLVECRKQPIFRALLRHVSHAAFKMLLEQYHIAQDALKHPGRHNADCTESYMRQHGLPCWHFMYAQHSLRQSPVIPLRMIHMHWQLYKAQLPEEEVFLRRIQDPAIRPLRGTRKRRNRTRSHDELRERRVPNRAAPTLETIQEDDELGEVLVPGTQTQNRDEVIDLTGDEPATPAPAPPTNTQRAESEAEYSELWHAERELYEDELLLQDLIREEDAALTQRNAAETADLVPRPQRRTRAPSTCSSCSQIGHTRRSRRCPNYAASSALL